MKVATTIVQLQDAVKQLKQQRGSSVGFVPTMGFLHAGHASLLKQARLENDIVVLSIFVNPLQFGPNEDLDQYPRDEQRDLQIAEEQGVDIAFLPTVGEMYPHGQSKTIVSVSEVTERLCGASRPGHFDGVATVVLKLFHIVAPTRAYFGLKDAQQIAVIEQMKRDLNLNIEIVPCPTVREADGLALSSRNVYLNETERKEAIILQQVLQHAKKIIDAKSADTKPSPAHLQAEMKELIEQGSGGKIDYAEILTYPELAVVTQWEEGQQYIVALAVKFGKTRLIDNMLI